MGKHKDTWALDVMRRLQQLGNSLGYVTSIEERRITRGWIDVCWIWNIPIIDKPLYLLIVEVETSKSNWVQIRNNAAKAVSLKPLIYLHIFKPGIELTKDEKEQLSEIHHGRHLLIHDGSMDIDNTLRNIEKYTKEDIHKRKNVFVVMQVHGGTFRETKEELLSLPGILELYEIFGAYDMLAVFTLKQADDMVKMHFKIGGLKGVKRSNYFVLGNNLVGSTVAEHLHL